MSPVPKSKPKSEAALHLEGTLDKLFPPKNLKGIGTMRQWATERRFCERRWKFDYVVTFSLSGGPKLGIEIEGIYYNGRQGKSRHQTGAGFEEDCRKYATATSLGWTIFRFTPNMILRGEAEAYLIAWLEGLPVHEAEAARTSCG